MKQYRATKVTQPEESQDSHEADPLDILAQRYKITDMGTEPSRHSKFQDVDQEFRAYIDGELYSKKLDPLKFWEVRVFS